MPNTRILPPPDGLHNSIRMPRGTVYTCAPGSFLDVPTQDAAVMEVNGWTRAFGPRGSVGPTSARPAPQTMGLAALERGHTYFDTTLNTLIVWSPLAGGVWRRGDTGAIV